MKKKGLIIATIVMVLVLAVSLTTATYAWFAAESKATISSISIATANASDISIGLKTNGQYAGDATAASFTSGDVTFNGKNVLDGDGTLGASITTGISLANLNKAVGTGTVAATPAESTADTEWDAAHAVIKANGEGTTAQATSIENATANGITSSTTPGDYVDWVIGFMPTKENIDTFTLNITITPNTTKPTLGLLAALHLRMAVNDGSFTDIDVYGSNHQNTLVGNVTTPSYTFQGGTGASAYATTVTTKTTASTIGGETGFITSITDTTATQPGAINIAIKFGTTNTLMTVNTITQLSFQLFYAGYDSDCITSALGVGADIYFTISNTVKA